jgi:hypothetical protein
MAIDEEIKRCTSKTFNKKGEKAEECGQPLLIILSNNRKDLTYICPECDGLERMPRETRERIVEQ